MYKWPKGIGSLALRPEYAQPFTSQVKFRARFYRPVIGVVLTLILLFTAIDYGRDDPYVAVFLAAISIVYWVFFALRLQLSKYIPNKYYRPDVQLARAILVIISVTAVNLVLAARGHSGHQIWLLYVTGTLLISEHNRAGFVWISLGMSSIFLFLSEFTGLVVWSGISSKSFFALYGPSILSRVTCLSLLTFVTDYLLRNIQGRDAAIDQQRHWFVVATQRQTGAESDGEVLAAFIATAEEITGARIRLWLPRIPDDRLECNQSDVSPENAEIAAKSGKKALVIQRELPRQLANVAQLRQFERLALWFSAMPSRLPDPIFSPDLDADVEMFIPVYKDEDPAEPLGVFDLVYEGRTPDRFELDRHFNWIAEFHELSRFRIEDLLKRRQSELVDELVIALGVSKNANAVISTFVRSTLAVLGFDSTSVWLVDSEQKHLVLQELDKLSPGQSLPLTTSGAEYDFRVRATLDNQTLVYGEHLIRSQKHKTWVEKNFGVHRYVWIPIRQVEPGAEGLPQGVIEVRLDQGRGSEISSMAISTLEAFSNHVAVRLHEVQQIDREHQQISQQKKLLDVAKELLESTVLSDVEQTIQVIGSHAVRLFQAPLLMIYTWDEEIQCLFLLYVNDPENSLRFPDELSLEIGGTVLERMYKTRASYFQPYAECDSLFYPQGQIDHSSSENRTFSKVHRIKSFAGAPLIGKAKDVLGFICLNYRTQIEFTEQEQYILESFATQAAYALEMARSQSLKADLMLEELRARMASETHDQLSQTIWSLGNCADAARMDAQNRRWDSVQERLDDIVSLNLKSKEDLNKLVGTRFRPLLCDKTFIELLDNFCKEIEDDYCVKIEFRRHGDRCRVPPSMQHDLLSIAKEAVTNAVRHSQCNTILVECDVEDTTRIYFMVQDDGCGFSPKAALSATTSCNGLKSMQQFAKDINCRLQIESQSGHGTRIILTSIET